MQTEHHIEAATIAVSNKVTAIGGVTAAASGVAVKAGLAVSINEITAIVGATCALLGLLISVYFQWRRDRREERVATANLKFGIVKHGKDSE